MPAFTNRERIVSLMAANPDAVATTLESILSQTRLDEVEAAFPMATDEKIAALRSMKREANKLGMTAIVDVAKAEIDKLQAEPAPRA